MSAGKDRIVPGNPAAEPANAAPKAEAPKTGSAAPGAAPAAANASTQTSDIYEDLYSDWELRNILNTPQPKRETPQLTRPTGSLLSRTPQPQPKRPSQNASGSGSGSGASRASDTGNEADISGNSSNGSQQRTFPRGILKSPSTESVSNLSRNSSSSSEPGRGSPNGSSSGASANGVTVDLSLDVNIAGNGNGTNITAANLSVTTKSVRFTSQTKQQR